MLGVDAEGNLVIVELKRGESPREVIAQLLEYAAWGTELPDVQIHKIAETYFENRDDFRGKTFPDAFREVFDMPKTDELPPLNQVLRLFIVAEEITTRIANVCRFLRTSHGMDISCIDFSTFQTESGEVLVNTEAKVGNEDIIVPKNQMSGSSQILPLPADKSTRDVVWEVVKELTKGSATSEFTLEDIRQSVLKKYPNFSVNTVRGVVNQDRVNDPAPNDNTIVNPNGKYWWVRSGTYRLYDPAKDKVGSDSEIN